jgi:uncharacterized protein YutE (UPF0331/DUF86 family)
LVDRAAVEARLARLDRELSMIEQVRGAGRDRFLADDGLQHQAERALQLAIQICIDVGAHLVAARGLRAPDEYRDVFERLSRDDTLDTALADRLKDAVGQRNLLVHGYVDLDPALIWEKLGEVEDLREFAGWALAAART